MLRRAMNCTTGNTNRTRSTQKRSAYIGSSCKSNPSPTNLARQRNADRPYTNTASTLQAWIDKWKPVEMRQAHVTDNAHVAYLDAQIKYVDAKKEEVAARQRVQECLDDLADAEDARRAKAAQHKRTPALK